MELKDSSAGPVLIDDTDVQAAIEAGRKLRQQREADAIAAKEVARKKRERELAETWAPIVEAVQNAIPQWAHQFIIQPCGDTTNIDHRRMEMEYAPVEIAVPGCTTIRAWTRGGTPTFEAATLFAQDTDMDDVDWIVEEAWRGEGYWRTVWGIQNGEDSFEAELSRAKENENMRKHLDEQCAALNALRHAKPEPLPERAADIDPITEVRKAIEAGDNTTSLMRGMLWGMLMLGSELRGIRNACEDIAAGVLFGPEQSTPATEADATSETVKSAADVLKRFVDGGNLVAYESDDLELVHEDARAALLAAQLLAIAEVGGRIAAKMEAK